MDKLITGFRMKYGVLFFILLNCAFVSANPLVDLIEHTKKSVVVVGTYMPKRAPKGLFLGTGFVITNGRLIVTNAHVLPKALNTKNLETLAVFYRKNSQIKMAHVEVVALDNKHDIAVLKLLSDKLPALSLGQEKVREGQLVAFTGYPIGMVLGLYPVTHRGMVSAISPVIIPMLKSRMLNAKLLSKLREPYDVYQLDATAYPGNSGSPVYNTETGRVIGIINKVFIKESKETLLSKPSGITYAIPIKYLNDLLKKNDLI